MTDLIGRVACVAVAVAAVIAISSASCGPPTRSNIPKLQQLPDAAIDGLPLPPPPDKQPSDNQP